MSKVSKADWSLALFAAAAMVLSFAVRSYSDFLGGLMVGLGGATIVGIVVRLVKPQHKA